MTRKLLQDANLSHASREVVAMNRRRCLLCLVPLLLLARVGWAGDAEAKDRAALTACLTGDYGKGVALLTELFVATKDPTYLYNQGRCYEQNRRYEDAIARFQEYLRAGRRLSRAEKADAQKHIADCKELLADQAPPQPVVSEPPPALGAAAVPAPAVVLAPVSEPTPAFARQRAAQPSAGAGWRTAGIVTAAIGGAAVVAGVALNLKVNSMAEDLEKTDQYSDAKESDRKTYRALGWAGYGVGVACVATGAVLYLLGRRPLRADSPPPVALVPTFATGQAGAVLQGAF